MSKVSLIPAGDKENALKAKVGGVDYLFSGLENTEEQRGLSLYPTGSPPCASLYMTKTYRGVGSVVGPLPLLL